MLLGWSSSLDPIESQTVYLRKSEGPACQVRRTMLDCPFRFRGRDKHAPPSGHDEHVPPIVRPEGPACQVRCHSAHVRPAIRSKQIIQTTKIAETTMSRRRLQRSPGQGRALGC